jgi:hypothetical protein
MGSLYVNLIYIIMARLLYLRDSAPFINGAVRRHSRLCRKFSGGEPFIKSITPVFNQFQDKQKALQQTADAREDAYDDIMLADRDLDNQIRTVLNPLASLSVQTQGKR